MWFFAWLVILCFAAIIFWWWQGRSMLKALKEGVHGSFNVTEVLKGPGWEYLVIDTEAQSLALVNTSVPSFDARGNIIRYDNMTVIFPIADIKSISVEAFTTSNTSVTFKFSRQIPSWNLDKILSFGGDPNVRKFFEKYLPHISVTYTLKTKDGKIEPWL